MNEYTVYTDGSCKPNPGKGGWAYLVIDQDGVEYIGSGGELNTTNNRMEMLAVIRSLESIHDPSKVRLLSDSNLIISTMKRHWKRNKNHDLWQIIDFLTGSHDITWEWVRGHNGDYNNERVDALAQAAAERQGGI